MADVEKNNAIYTTGEALGSPTTSHQNTPLQSETGPTLQRQLKARHVQMIALGTNIGTGLFIGSGAALATGGPLSLVVAFTMMSGLLTVMMQCLGEMACLLPVSGSFTDYASRFFDRSLGFAISWQYWLLWVSGFASEASAFVILISYWQPDTKFTPLWISIFLIIIVLIHMSPVRIFGEIEAVISTLKIIIVIISTIVLIVLVAGGGPSGERHGAEYWHQPGLEDGLANGFYGFASVFVLAAYACGGTEQVGIIAGETQHPLYNMPRAVRTTMWRVFAFYVPPMIFLSLTVSYDNSRLVGRSNASSSPFVIAIEDAGIKVLPDFLNAAFMVCVLSVASTTTYSASRILRALSLQGFGPQIFTRVDSKGRPYVGLIFSFAVMIILAYLNVSSTGAVVFRWFASIAGLTLFWAWLTIIACNWRFRAALKAQGDMALSKRFQYNAKLWPYLSILAFVAFAFMVICQLIVAIRPAGGQGSVQTFFSNFLGGITFPLFYIGHEIVYRPPFVKLEDIDLQTGRREPGAAEIAKLEHYHSLPWAQRALTYFRF